jgi:tetratricopeptide (TPR) repeat protein
MTAPARRSARWLADSGRLLSAFVYWNARKTVYVARGRAGHCPCQNPSDDDVPGKVRCDAVAHWNDPARFRTVCPLLVRNEARREWCCSVDHRGVRPFWGRAAAWTGGLALGGYAVAALAAFCVLRLMAGVPVSLPQVAWPGRWAEVRIVQADVFYLQAIDAFQRRRLDEAHLALVSARARHPDHYPASLLLGQIAMFRGGFLFADDYFDQLLTRAPQNRFQTAVTYHDTLLALGRLDPVAAFSLRMAAEDSGRAAFWVRSLVLVVRRHPEGAVFAAQHRAGYARLAPHARMLVEAEALLAVGDRARAVALLREPHRGPLNFVYMALQIERLAELGRTGDAQVLLDFYGAYLDPFEGALAQYTIDRLAGDDFTARASLRRLLALPLTEVQVGRIVERLVRWPDAAAVTALRAAVEARPALAGARISAALWVAALASGARTDAAAWRVRAAQVEHQALPAVDRVDFRSSSFQDPASPRFLASAVDLPREVVFALALRSAEERAARPR